MRFAGSPSFIRTVYRVDGTYTIGEYHIYAGSSPSPYKIEVIDGIIQNIDIYDGMEEAYKKYLLELQTNNLGYDYKNALYKLVFAQRQYEMSKRGKGLTFRSVRQIKQAIHNIRFPERLDIVL